MAAIVAQPEIEVPFLAGHGFASLAVLEDGRFALSGTRLIPSPDEYPDHAYLQFEVQTYSREGIPLGNPFVPQPAHPADNGMVGSLGDRYFVAWQHFLAKASRATRISGSGEIVGKAFPWLNSEVYFFGSYYRYGGSPTWKFLPVTYRLEGVDWLGNDIRVPLLQVYDRNAKPIGSAAKVTRQGWVVYIDDIAMSADGRFVVASDQCPNIFNPPLRSCERVFQVFDASGRALTARLTEGGPQLPNRDGSGDGPAVAAMDPAGGIALGWEKADLTNTQTLVVRLFDSSGAPTSVLTTVTQTTLPEASGLLRPIALGDGHYAIPWVVVHPDGIWTLHMAELHSRNRLSRPVTIASGRVADGFQIALNGAGQGVVTWTTLDSNHVFTGHLRLIAVH
jgi:hypothetical protein